MDTPLAPPRSLDLEESVAGEEDPGASIDTTLAAGKPAAAQPTAASPAPDLKPGDEAPAGTPGTGEDVCPQCGGSGRLAGRACPMCEGTGKVTQAIGGG